MAKKRRHHIKKCAVCGKPLVRNQTRYCSKPCARIEFNRLRQLSYRNILPLIPKKCKNCKKRFTPKKTNLQLFCGDRCKSSWDAKLDRKRHKIKILPLGSSSIRCHSCGRKHSIILEIRPSSTKGLRGRFRFQYRVYNATKYKRLRKKLPQKKAKNIAYTTKTCYSTKIFSVSIIP